MAKTIIAHAVCRAPYSMKLDVLAVTTIRPNGRIWGRTMSDDTPTNRARRDVLAFYKTEAAANAAIERAFAARAPHLSRLEVLDAMARQERDEMRDAELEALQSADRLHP